jgi:23S rRNA pseudouridine1911/1915/1917 synthase
MKPPRLRWVVERGPLRLSDLVGRLGAEAQSALSEGRLFVDGRRESDPAQLLGAGSAVEIFDARSGPVDLQVTSGPGDLVVVNKPAALATLPDHSGGTNDVRSLAARKLGLGPSELHALSRLDVGVSGVVLLVRVRAGHRTRRPHDYERRYVAITPVSPEPEHGVWTSPIEHGARGSRRAETRYARVARATGGGVFGAGRERVRLEPALLVLWPATGRTHQLRIHAARAGAPIFGDRRHGGLERLAGPDGSIREIGRIALHALSIRVSDPELGEFRAEAAPPSELVELWRAFGGRDSDWAAAASLL